MCILITTFDVLKSIGMHSNADLCVMDAGIWSICLGVSLCYRSSSLQGLGMGPLLLEAMPAMPHRLLQVSH